MTYIYTCTLKELEILPSAEIGTLQYTHFNTFQWVKGTTNLSASAANFVNDVDDELQPRRANITSAYFPFLFHSLSLSSARHLSLSTSFIHSCNFQYFIQLLMSRTWKALKVFQILRHTTSQPSVCALYRNAFLLNVNLVSLYDNALAASMRVASSEVFVNILL